MALQCKMIIAKHTNKQDLTFKSHTVVVTDGFQGGMPPVVPFSFTVKIYLDQEITDSGRHVQIYNDIHIVTRKYTDMYRKSDCFDIKN